MTHRFRDDSGTGYTQEFEEGVKLSEHIIDNKRELLIAFHADGACLPWVEDYVHGHDLWDLPYIDALEEAINNHKGLGEAFEDFVVQRRHGGL